jgi:hypothetical protein
VILSTGYLIGAFLGALAITFILASIANRFLKRPLLAGVVAGGLTTLVAHLVGRLHDPIIFVFYWLGAGLSALILRSRAKKAEAAPASTP